MNTYIHVPTNVYPLTESMIRAAFPNISFPAAFVPPTGYEMVFRTPRPTHDPLTHSVVETLPVKTGNGHWEQRWNVVQLSPSQAQQNQQKAQQEMIARFDAGLTAHLDKVAQSKKYDNRITCMVRAGFPGPFQAEGMAFAAWADQCNMFAYTLMQQVMTGQAPAPASVDAFISQLPQMVWPS